MYEKIKRNVQAYTHNDRNIAMMLIGWLVGWMVGTFPSWLTTCDFSDDMPFFDSQQQNNESLE